MAQRHGTIMGWAIVLMRAGYAGRGLVYLAVAGLSLESIRRGGQAQDTSSALGWVQDSRGGGIALAVILFGMVAYAVWRILDAVFDLEEYGSEGKGIVARLGMLVSAALHLGIGLLAFTLLSGGGEGGSSTDRYVRMVMEWPAGRWMVGLAALLILGAGAHYVRQGWTGEYRRHLRASRFTTRWNAVLGAGVIAHGLVIAIIGLLFAFAAWQADPQEAGGTGEAFGWLAEQAYGQMLVIAICLGLVAFAWFCFVNAVYRIVPRLSGPDVQSLAASLMARATR